MTGITPIIHFQRRALPGQNSVERLAADIREHLPSHIQCEVRILPCYSKGLFRRLANVLYCAAPRSRVRHITGDTSYAGLLGPSGKTLLTILDCVSLHRLEGWRRSLLRLLWYDWPIRHARLVTVISDFVRQELLSLVPCDARKVRRVYLPVSDHFSRCPKPALEPKPVILQVGTGPNKNLERVAAALEGLPWRLNVLGRLTPAQETVLKERRVDFSARHGLEVGEVARMYREADVVVFASTYEGFGLPIIEANATGRPVVTSNCSSMPEIAGDAACIVDPLDPSSIRQGLMRVVSDAGFRNHLTEAGFINAARFSGRKIAAEYAALYEELAEFEPAASAVLARR